MKLQSPKSEFKNYRKGQAALTVALFFVFISFIVSGAFSGTAAVELKSAKSLSSSKQSYIFAEGAVEDAAYRLISGKNLPSQVVYAEDSLQATTTYASAGGTATIDVSSTQFKALRKIRSILVPGGGVSFNYGIQVGSGGLEMEQNSEVRGSGGEAGSVYSNGDVEGENGAKITGDLTVAGNNSMDGVIVLGTARAHEINDSKICGDAYYQTIDSSSFSFLNNPSGSTCPEPETPGTAFPGSADPVSKDMPISDQTIQSWKDTAASGGVINGNCGDSGSASCVIENNETLSLGPKKINGDLKLTKKQTLVITGAVYFTGNLDIDSSSGATIKCDPSFGTKSCLIITDSWVHVENNSTFQGSGTAGSYIMVLSTLAGCNGSGSGCTHHDAALDLHNNATGAIFYIPNSMAYLHNGVNITELTANKIHLDNNAVVTYEQGLANAQFDLGPSGGYKIDGWQEIP
ncbi:MAG: hypothetical protein HY446_01240 [Candidatus Niyogibacteria bacterium]|nr:hypothetical protein [Candidatus Niyogibacteria bacterium]